MGQGQWPLALTLGCPTEAVAQQQPDAVRAWIAAWRTWQGSGEVIWCERRWRVLGNQQLPDKLVLYTPQQIADWLGEEPSWQRVEQRYRQWVSRWPILRTHLPRYFDVLANYSEDDLQRLEAMLAWLKMNPRSQLYPRQLPIAGLDTKWLEGRRALIADLLAALQEDEAGSIDFFQRCGLKPLTATIRLRVLDPDLRRKVGGLADITAPIDDLAALDLSATRIYIVENLQTGLAFGDLTGAVVFMRLGYNVDALARLPWLARSLCFYWGDIDTHGFAILSRARAYLPNIKSLLMDERTLREHTALCVPEDTPHAATELPLLTDAEQSVYRGLKQQRWGVNVRLEQERIRWDYAWSILTETVHSRSVDTQLIL